MIGVEEARTLILENTAPSRPQRVGLDAALGRILAAGVRRVAVPRHLEWARISYLGCDGLPSGSQKHVEDGLLTGGGYVRFDAFGLPLDGGLVLSALDGDPRFEDFKARWRARREAAREKMIEMESAGEIPRPTGGAG